MTKRDDKVVNEIIRYTDDDMTKRDDKVVNEIIRYTDDEIVE